MSKRCSRCEKTVYPIEELKCLDKVWHKGCFKCQECGMTLSMKTYKGFNKLPYCEAHIPKAKATVVAETPEIKRIAENTKIQSNVQYHADFEKNKAKFTQVADDPETQRIKQNTKIISNVSYHGELEKKAIMEKKRSDSTGDEYSQAETLQNEEQLMIKPLQSSQQSPSIKQSHAAPPQMHRVSPHHHTQQSSHVHHSQAISQNSQPPYQGGASHSYSPTASNHIASQPYYQHQPSAQQSARQLYHQQSPSSNYYSGFSPSGGSSNPSTNAYHHQHRHNMAQQNLYQDANHNSPYSASRNTQTLIYTSQTGPVQQPVSKHIGSIADYDPMNDQYGSIAQNKNQTQPGRYRQDTSYQRGNVYHDGAGSGGTVLQQASHAAQQKISAPPTHIGRCYRAMYDYEAADTDEVSFRDGDLLINCTSIDEGWMTGTVQRTGKTGMLPANYVERVS